MAKRDPLRAVLTDLRWPAHGKKTRQIQGPSCKRQRLQYSPGIRAAPQELEEKSTKNRTGNVIFSCVWIRILVRNCCQTRPSFQDQFLDSFRGVGCLGPYSCLRAWLWDLVSGLLFLRIWTSFLRRALWLFFAWSKLRWGRFVGRRFRFSFSQPAPVIVAIFYAFFYEF